MVSITGAPPEQVAADLELAKRARIGKRVQPCVSGPVAHYSDVGGATFCDLSFDPRPEGFSRQAVKQRATLK
jgi:hypothetical protein